MVIMPHGRRYILRPIARQIGMGSDLSRQICQSDKIFTVRVGNLKNVSYDDFSGKIAVALFSASGEFKALLSKTVVSRLAECSCFTAHMLILNAQLPPV